MRRSSLILKGFIRKAKDGSFEGICLTLNLAVRGQTLEEADRKLLELITAYLQDAEQSGTWGDLVPRHAPFSYYLTYYKFGFLSRFRTIVDFKLFIQSAPRSLAHA